LSAAARDYERRTGRDRFQFVVDAVQFQAEWLGGMRPAEAVLFLHALANIHSIYGDHAEFVAAKKQIEQSTKLLRAALGLPSSRQRVV
jgi:hypothetical protein